MLIEEIEKKIDEVLEKDFKNSIIGGYKKSDVDLFLDELVDFYEHIINRLTIDEKEGDEVVRENLKLKNQLIMLEQRMNEFKKSKEFDEIILKQKLAEVTQELSRLRR